MAARGGPEGQNLINLFPSWPNRAPAALNRLIAIALPDDPLLPLYDDAAGLDAKVTIKLTNVPAPVTGVTFFVRYIISTAHGFVWQGQIPLGGGVVSFTFPWSLAATQVTLDLWYYWEWVNLNGQIGSDYKYLHFGDDPAPDTFTPTVAAIVPPTLNPPSPTISSSNANTATLTTPGSYSLDSLLPAGTFTISAKLWSCGGYGVDGDETNGGGGGGGSASVLSTFQYTKGAGWTIQVGQSGAGDPALVTWIKNGGTTIAQAAPGKAAVGTTAGAGGLSADCVGDVAYSGGAGANAAGAFGGGGGGSAGRGSAGNPASGTGGGNPVPEGGRGGQGGDNANGTAGQQPGAGAGGGAAGRPSGAPGNGKMVLMW